MTEECETCTCGNADDAEGISDEEFANFCELQTEEGAIPAGRIEYVTGKVLYRSGAGYLLSAEAYEAKYGFDPEPVWKRIQAFRAQPKTAAVIAKLDSPVEPKKVPMKPVQLSRLPQFRG